MAYRDWICADRLKRAVLMTLLILLHFSCQKHGKRKKPVPLRGGNGQRLVLQWTYAEVLSHAKGTVVRKVSPYLSPNCFMKRGENMRKANDSVNAVHGMITLDELRAAIGEGEIDTVLAVFPDLYGR